MKKKITVGTLVRYLPEVIEGIEDPGLAVVIELAKDNPNSFIYSFHDIRTLWLQIKGSCCSEECSSDMEVISE
jgi:hypothetical protein